MAAIAGTVVATPSVTSASPTARRRSAGKREDRSSPTPTPSIARVATTNTNVGKFKARDFIYRISSGRRLPDSASRLEKLDCVAIRVFHLNLPAAGPDLHCISEGNSRLVEPIDVSGEIVNFQDHPVPPAGRLRPTVRHGTRTRGLWSAEQQLEFAERDRRECRQVLTLYREAKVLAVERDGVADIGDLIPDTVPLGRDTRCAGLIGYGRGFLLCSTHETLLDVS